MSAISLPNHRTMTLKKNLRLLIDRRGISATALARLVGVPKSSINEWLNGVEPRKLAHVKKVAEHFGVSVDALCFGQVDVTSDKVTSDALGVLMGDGVIKGRFDIIIKRVKD